MPCEHAFQNVIIQAAEHRVQILVTEAHLVPEETLTALEPILGRYLDRSGVQPAWKR